MVWLVMGIVVGLRELPFELLAVAAVCGFRNCLRSAVVVSLGFTSWLPLLVVTAVELAVMKVPAAFLEEDNDEDVDTAAEVLGLDVAGEPP